MTVYTRSRERPIVFDVAAVDLPGEEVGIGGVLRIYVSYTTVDLGSGNGRITWTVSPQTLEAPFDQLIGASDTYEVYHASKMWHAITTDDFSAYLSGLLSAIKITPVASSYPSVLITAGILDNPTKGFHKIIASGGIVNTAVHNQKRETRAFYSNNVEPKMVTAYVTPSNGNYTSRLSGVRAIGTTISNILPPTEADLYDVDAAAFSVMSNIASGRQSAVNSAFGKLNSGSYEYLVELAELPETLGYLTSSFKRIASMMKSIKRGKFKDFAPRTDRKLQRKAKRLAKEHGTTTAFQRKKLIVDFSLDAWMELRFGIRPLLYGVSSAIDHYNEKVGKLTDRITVNHRDRIPFTGATTTTTIDNSVRMDVIDEWHGTEVACAGILAKVDATTATLRNLGFTNVGGALWELTFASWAVDYFVSIDALIYHFTPNIGIYPLASWSSSKREINFTRTVRRSDAIDGKLIDVTTYRCVHESYQRDPDGKPGFISLDVNLDDPRLLDLIGLFRGLYKSLSARK